MAGCPICGYECPKQAKHCPKCGNLLQTEQQAAKNINIIKIKNVWNDFVRNIIPVIKTVGKGIKWAAVKLLLLITKPIGRFIRKHPIRFGLLIEFFVFLGIVAFYINVAFDALGEDAIGIVAFPASFLFLGLMLVFVDLSTPEGKKKYKIGLQKAKNWFDKNGEGKKIAILAVVGAIEFIICILTLVHFVSPSV